MAAEQIQDIIDQGKYRRYGIRVASKTTDRYRPEYVSGRNLPIKPDLKVGRIAPRSHVWVDGNPSRRKLDGTCALGVRAEYDHAQMCGDLLGEGPKKQCGNGGYAGNQIVLLGCDYAETGEDVGEIVMMDAYVLATWSRQEFLATD